MHKMGKAIQYIPGTADLIKLKKEKSAHLKLDMCKRKKWKLVRKAIKAYGTH